MRKSINTAAGLIAALVSTATFGQALSPSQTTNSWFQNGAASVQDKLVVSTNTRAKNVILFVGDGMGISTLTAARILEGQTKGSSGEENELSFERFPHTALVKTYNVNAQIPDSAGTMTAMMSGLKTDAGVVGVDEDIVRGDCSSAAGNEVVSAIELAEIKGLATGIVSTARITHATPAAAYAKSANRDWEDISDMPADAVAGGCVDIATQLIQFEENLEARFAGVDVDGLEVVMGGGRRHFLPKLAAANSPDATSAIEGDRTDNRNLVEDWIAKYPDGEYVYDQAGLKAIDTTATSRVFGLFNESHMRYENDRANDLAGEPSLTEMTTSAIEILSRNDRGFLLVVESGRIDHGHHASNAYTALKETIKLSDAVRAADQMTDDNETLILVTADHSHAFTIAGYPKRGNPILGKVVAVNTDRPARASDGFPYTTLSYMNGPGFASLGSGTDPDVRYDNEITMGRADLSSIDTTKPGFYQEALVPLSSETHAGEDVALHAKGAGARLVSGTIEQNVVYHYIHQALGLALSN